jgi:glycosyltransferase involved in cell wall biosynthesis
MESLPLVSIVMPVRNEAGFIERSIEAVLAQDYPAARIEIIVADGLSTDGTRDAVLAAAEKHPNLRLIDNPGLIAPTGLNAAVKEAAGDVIVRVDGHCEIQPSYVRCCVEHLRTEGVDGVGGPLVTVGGTRMARAIAAAMSSKFGVGGSAFRTVSNRTLFTDTVAFPAYKRTVMERAGLFDEELVRNQDDEYNYRLRGLGAGILLAHDVRAKYYSRGSLRSLCRQYFQYGFWKVRVMQKHRRQMRMRQFAPPAFVLSLIVPALATPLDSSSLLVTAAVAGLYLTANFASSLVVARTAGWRLLPLLPLAFASLHFSYGFGFLAGLARFWRRWSETERVPAFERSSHLG